MTLRSAERGHDYHAHMHQIIERLERLLTLIVLLLLGVSLTHGLLGALGWHGMLIGFALVFVIRPLSGMLALGLGRAEDRVGEEHLNRRERRCTAFFGVRGVGSLYYLAYATSRADFGDHAQLWAVVGFTITLSVVVHGITATPAMKWLDQVREDTRA
jgi:sodium/hydrogen antiporter